MKTEIKTIANKLVSLSYEKLTTYSKFENLIHPFTSEEFFQHYYEKNYLHIARNNPNYYDAILNTDDIDLFFQNKSLQSNCLRVVEKGEELPAYKWTHRNSSIANNDTLFVLFNQGKTLIINSGNSSIIKLVNYCSDLEKELKFRLQFNIYITPHNSQGFAPHYDDHDVFIMQTTGTKVWRLYNTPIELPSRKQPYWKIKDQYELGEPTFEVELTPGDLLYIPRGLIHDALTTDTASVHITLGFHPNYWFEILQEIAELAEEKAEFRKAVPNGITAESYQSKFKQDFLSLTQSLINNLDLDEILERKFYKYIDSKLSEDQNRFKDSIQVNQLTLNSVLAKRPNIFYKLERDDENVYVKFYGKKLDFPRFTEPSINTLLQSQSFAVKDIGGLVTDEGKIDLATKFIQEGFLTIEQINA
ncbi:cupin domain-containing protein [Moorena producens]|uniref:cupin domain-containing protein n=1 Tax=Moorena producens TaxID=1155739 RepID=UPI003C717B9F